MQSRYLQSPMSSGKTEQWLRTGYQMVAQSGFDSISVESLSKKVGKNKSSFYHYFGDLEVFEEALLQRHVDLAEGFAEEVAACESIRPGMLEVFLEHQDDLFFHRQLRIGREHAGRRKAFEKAHEKFEQAVMPNWSSFLQLEDQAFLAQAFLRLVSENFLLRITPDNYRMEWLDAYMQEVAGLITGFKS